MQLLVPWVAGHLLGGVVAHCGGQDAAQQLAGQVHFPLGVAYDEQAVLLGLGLELDRELLAQLGKVAVLEQLLENFPGESVEPLVPVDILKLADVLGLIEGCRNAIALKIEKQLLI